MKVLHFILLCQNHKQLKTMNMKSNQIEIILIEDNASDAKFTIMALKGNNISNNIVHLKDGEEALHYIFENPEFDATPKLILLDLKMPKVDGIEVLRRLKGDERTKMIPVAVFTSSQEDPDVKECYRLGVNSYIVKPVEFDAFAKVISDAGFYWSVINHPAQ
jgi:two-component system, response regulator